MVLVTSYHIKEVDGCDGCVCADYYIHRDCGLMLCSHQHFRDIVERGVSFIRLFMTVKERRFFVQEFVREDNI